MHGCACDEVWQEGTGGGLDAQPLQQRTEGRDDEVGRAPACAGPPAAALDPPAPRPPAQRTPSDNAAAPGAEGTKRRRLDGPVRLAAQGSDLPAAPGAGGRGGVTAGAACSNRQRGNSSAALPAPHRPLGLGLHVFGPPVLMPVKTVLQWQAMALRAAAAASHARVMEMAVGVRKAQEAAREQHGSGQQAGQQVQQAQRAQQAPHATGHAAAPAPSPKPILPDSEQEVLVID